MSRLKVGAFLSSFKLDMRSALDVAQEIGLAGIQFSNLRGEVNVEDISDSQAGEIVGLFADRGLVISSVCGDIGGYALEDEGEAAKRVERTKRIMDNTRLLGCDIVQSHIGHIKAGSSERKEAVLMRSLEAIGEYGERVGVLFASETGLEPCGVLKELLDRLAVPAIRVNFDPANLVMNGFDHMSGVYELRDYIVHTHAKDGLREPNADGEKEVPLGEGEVDFPRYIAAMDDIGFEGFYTIEREVGDDPAADIVRAKKFLDTL